MGLPRDLVSLEEQLRAAAVDVFSPNDQAAVCAVAQSSGVLSKLQALDLSDATSALLLVAQSLRVQHHVLSPYFLKAELVATLPPAVPGLARPTKQVLIEMLKPGAREVILLGYELSDRGIIDLLQEVAASGADVLMICDRIRGTRARIKEQWNHEAPLPRIFEDQERATAAPHASMHAKCLLVDGKDLLITSANFTFHGLHGNIEIGVRISGAAAAEARKIFSHLVESGIVREVAET